MPFKEAPGRRDDLPRRFHSYIVDRVRVGDLPRIARLERVLFPEPLALPTLARLWSISTSYYVVIRQGHQVAGYIGFQVFGPSAHTISMGVHPDHRRQGLATLLQRTADRVAAGRGARWFMGEVRVSNAAQLAFLEKIGWKEIGIRHKFFGDGEDAVVVWTRLPEYKEG